jgi:hypothetical protein
MIPEDPVGGEENTSDRADDATAVIAQSAPDLAGIGKFGAGPFNDIEYQYVMNSPNDNNEFQVWMCGANIAGFADRYAGSQSPYHQVALGQPQEQNYSDSKCIF